MVFKPGREESNGILGAGFNDLGHSTFEGPDGASAIEVSFKFGAMTHISCDKL